MATETVTTKQGGEWTGEREQALTAGIARLAAVRLADGDYAFRLAFAWLRVSEDEVLELGASILLAEPDPMAYWHQTGRVISDLDHDGLDAVQNAGLAEGSVEFRCQCGDWSGERCTSTGPRHRLIEVRFVPEHQHGPARASGTFASGAYASTVYVDPKCAEKMRHRREDGEQTDQEDEFVRVVGPAYETAEAVESPRAP